MNKSAFRAYDIRGKYPREVNEEMAADVSECLYGKFFGGTGKVVVGMDARKSSPKIYRAVLKKLRLCGADIIQAGRITTPELTFLVHTLAASGGIMITASHNPKNENGIKAMKGNGYVIGGTEIFDVCAK